MRQEQDQSNTGQFENHLEFHLDSPPPQKIAKWLLDRMCRSGDRMTDYSHQVFVSGDDIKDAADIRKYYGAAQFVSWKRLNSRKPLNVVPSPEGSRVSASAVKGLRPGSSAATAASDDVA
jgi:hypothetical protein